MPQLTIPKQYQDGQTLLKSALDAAFDSVETFTNLTKLDGTNIQDASIGPTQLTNTIGDNSTIEQDGTTNRLQIKDLGITTAKLADASITTAKLADASITTSKIADGAVTLDKLVARNVTFDGSDPGLGGVCASAAYTNAAFSSTSYANLAGLYCSISILQNPIIILTEPGSSSASKIQVPAGKTASIQLVRNGSTTLAAYSLSNTSSADLQVPVTLLQFMDNPGAGTHTYTLQASISAGGTLIITNIRLTVYELI